MSAKFMKMKIKKVNKKSFKNEKNEDMNYLKVVVELSVEVGAKLSLEKALLDAEKSQAIISCAVETTKDGNLRIVDV